MFPSENAFMKLVFGLRADLGGLRFTSIAPPKKRKKTKAAPGVDPMNSGWKNIFKSGSDSLFENIF